MNAKHRDGPHNEARSRLEGKLARELGDVILAALADPEVVEIMLNQDGFLWEDRHGAGMTKIGEMSATRAENLIGTIANDLGVDASRDLIVEGELSLDGSRFEGILPPLVERPIFALRKKAVLIYTFADYVRDGIMTEAQRQVLIGHIKLKHNILVVGGTGSGKTTLCNAILQMIAELFPNTRMAIIEDTRELQCPIENKFNLRTSKTVDYTELLRVCMRLRPDSITVGEVRDKAALALIKAWNTGHGGGTGTTHANDAQAGLTRIEQLIQEANVPPIKAVIADAIHCVVSIQKTAEGRRINQICTVKGGSPDGYDLEFH